VQSRQLRVVGNIGNERASVCWQNYEETSSSSLAFGFFILGLSTDASKIDSTVAEIQAKCDILTIISNCDDDNDNIFVIARRFITRIFRPLSLDVIIATAILSYSAH